MPKYKESYCIIDIETASGKNIEEGLVNYVKDKDFHILLISYKIDDKEIVTLTNFERDKNGPKLPKELLEFDGYFVAHNWFFEFICLNVTYRNITKIFRDEKRWLCTASLSRYFALGTGKLQFVAEQLKLDEKLQIGKKLISTYSKPNIYNKFEQISDIDKELFIEYNQQDVKLTAEIFKLLYPKWPKFERKVWEAHKWIATNGISVDISAAQKIYDDFEKLKSEAVEEARKIAGVVENSGALVISSQAEFLKFLETKFHIKLDNVRESTLEKLKGKSKELDHVLQLRKIISSRAAYKAELILKHGTSNWKIFDGFVYCGAHTGRWASWGVNFFNFPRDNTPNDEQYSKLLQKDRLSLEEIKSMQRGIITASKSYHTLIISDFKSIELHLLLYCAGHEEQLKILENGGSLYIYFGEKAFKKKIEKGTKEYQISKSAVLGLGYGAGPNVFANLANIDIETSKRIARVWREMNQPIVKYWEEIEKAFKSVATNQIKAVTLPRRIKIMKSSFYENGVEIELPNKFKMYYPNVKIENDEIYCSWDNYAPFHKLWGGLLVENIMQSLCRQLLADSLVKLHNENINVVLHVYDEIVCDVTKNGAEIYADKIANIMTSERSWLPNFKPQVEQKFSWRWGK